MDKHEWRKEEIKRQRQDDFEQYMALFIGVCFAGAVGCGLWYVLINFIQ